jgi:hypothetical protein
VVVALGAPDKSRRPDQRKQWLSLNVNSDVSLPISIKIFPSWISLQHNPIKPFEVAVFPIPLGRS